jgi:hypothetical protein
MTKSQIIAWINQNYKAGLNNTNTHFSSINKSKEVWWTTVPLNKFNSDVHFLLCAVDYALWVQLPKGFVKQLPATFKIREDTNTVDVEISAHKNFKYFLDLKSGGTEFNFAPFAKEKIVY